MSDSSKSKGFGQSNDFRKILEESIKQSEEANNIISSNSNKEEEEDNCECPACTLRRAMASVMEGKNEPDDFDFKNLIAKFDRSVKDRNSGDRRMNEYAKYFAENKEVIETELNFKDAMEQLQAGVIVSRGDWYLDVHIELINDVQTLCVSEARFNYSPSKEDMEANDWLTLKFK